MENSIANENDLTPACALGFIDRLIVLLNYAGLHKSGFIAFLIDATGMSASGARRIITDKRPPKRLAAFKALAAALATLASRKADCNITTEDVATFLLENKPIEALSPPDSFGIARFLEDDPVKTSQIIIAIENVIKGCQFDTSTLPSEKMRLIRYRIINFCFKNNEDGESEKVSTLIKNLLELASQNLL